MVSLERKKKLKSWELSPRYTILQTLKTTLCGRLILAEDTQLKCLVAIKESHLNFLKLNCTENPLEEIRLMTKLREGEYKSGSQYVIGLLATYAVDCSSKVYSVLEFANGGELFENLQNISTNGERLDLSIVRKAFTMIAKGLRFIHKNGVCHLDLSLENILITEEGLVKICDFGMAREGRHFFCSQPRGKNAYMAPEIYRREAYDGWKADVWSLGVILWSLLSCFGLYKKPDDTDSIYQIVKRGKKGLRQIAESIELDDIPDVIFDLLSGMLNVNPSLRYNIDDVLAHPFLNPSTPLNYALNSLSQEEKSSPEVLRAGYLRQATAPCLARTPVSPTSSDPCLPQVLQSSLSDPCFPIFPM